MHSLLNCARLSLVDNPLGVRFVGCKKVPLKWRCLKMTLHVAYFRRCGFYYQLGRFGVDIDELRASHQSFFHKRAAHLRKTAVISPQRAHGMCALLAAAA